MVSRPTERRLSQGLVIKAAVVARLLGIRLLTLRADIAVLPAPPERTDPGPMRRSLNGEASGSLAEAARALEAGASDLRAARELLSPRER